MNTTLTTLPVCIVEEIGFEGLEGITIEGLWKRISVRMRLALPLKDRLKNETWKFICNPTSFAFYSLPEEREPLIIYDRMEYADNTGSNDTVSCFFVVLWHHLTTQVPNYFHCCRKLVRIMFTRIIRSAPTRSVGPANILMCENRSRLNRLLI